MNRTLSCLVIPSQTACFTSRPHQAKGLGSALCVEPAPEQPMHSQQMPFEDQYVMFDVSLVLCIPHMTEVPASI